MNSKLIKSTACLAILITAFNNPLPLKASGIPVVDGALFGATAQHNFQTVLQWGKEAAHWAQQITHYTTVIDNWKTNFQNMLRSKISDFFGIKLSDKISEKELTAIWEKGRARCNQISNPASKSYCHQMISLEIEKIQLYFAGEDSIEKQWQQFLNKRTQYNALQGAGNNNANQLQTISEEMDKILQKIEIDMNLYQQRVNLIDTRIEWMRKTRVKIAQEQLKGTNRTIVDNISKAAVIATLETNRSSYKNKAERLRRQNSTISNDAFFQK